MAKTVKQEIRSLSLELRRLKRVLAQEQRVQDLKRQIVYTQDNINIIRRQRGQS